MSRVDYVWQNGQWVRVVIPDPVPTIPFVPQITPTAAAGDILVYSGTMWANTPFLDGGLF